jgi:hypothetical protein
MYTTSKEAKLLNKLRSISQRDEDFFFFQVEPSTKLYPAVFLEPTVKEVLQFELGRIKV